VLVQTKILLRWCPNGLEPALDTKRPKRGQIEERLFSGRLNFRASGPELEFLHCESKDPGNPVTTFLSLVSGTAPYRLISAWLSGKTQGKDVKEQHQPRTSVQA